MSSYPAGHQSQWNIQLSFYSLDAGEYFYVRPAYFTHNLKELL
jgi:hypothetical protein